ncbi:MAG: tetratricopeptide (TPR) repeat protein [Crocinitomix sp.]|jgi:tetratricopeptide (TPR) repeat protein
MRNWAATIILICSFVFSGYAQQDAKAIKEGEKYAEKAKKAFEKDDFEKALQFYTEAINANPLEENYYLNRGITYEYLSNETAAIEDYTKGIELNPEHSLCYIERSHALLILDDFHEAYNDAMMHSKIHGENDESLSRKKLTLLKLKEYEKAIPVISKIIENDIEDPHLYLQRAKCYIETANFNAANADINKAIALGNDNGYDFYDIQGLYYLRKNEPRKSIDAYNKILIETYAYTPLPESYYNCSNAFYALGKLDSALIQMNKALVKGSKPEYYLDRGSYLAEMGDLDNALLDFNKAIELAPKLGAAYNNRAFYIWLPQSDYQKAVKDLTQVINFDPDNAYAYSNRSSAYLGLKDYENAFIDAFKSVELEPKNPYVYRTLALLYSAIDEKDEAKNAAQGALSWGLPTEGDPVFQNLMISLGLE